MWWKSLILSMVFAMALPVGKAGAAPTGLQDEAQPQVSVGGKSVTTVPAAETALAVPADVKWAHRLATGFGILGILAGVVQLWYIWEYKEQVYRDEKFGEKRWYCSKRKNGEVTYFSPDLDKLRYWEDVLLKLTIISSVSELIVYLTAPFIKPAMARKTDYADACVTVPIMVLSTALLATGASLIFGKSFCKGYAIQLCSLGAMWLCMGYKSLLMKYINHKAAEALAHKANTAAVAGDQTKQLKLA
jgi:hypothetical protein